MSSLVMPRKPKPKAKRTRNPRITRAKLLQATIELVSEKGAAALSLKEAAIRAKVSRGVAYMHFDDRDQLLREAKTWIAEGLQEVVKRFDKNASLRERTYHSTKIVLDHPEATKLLLMAAMDGEDLNRDHPLYQLVLGMLKELKTSGKLRPDIDLEILTYITFGSIASTIMLGAQRKGDDLGLLAERFAEGWSRILTGGIFVSKSAKRKHRPA